jgi:hypothetical protein
VPIASVEDAEQFPIIEQADIRKSLVAPGSGVPADDFRLRLSMNSHDGQFPAQAGASSFSQFTPLVILSDAKDLASKPTHLRGEVLRSDRADAAGSG